MRFFRAWSQQCEDDRNAPGQRPLRGLAGPRNPARRGNEEVIDKLTRRGEKDLQEEAGHQWHSRSSF